MNPELKQTLTTVTPLSKYLAMALFVILPFAGLFVGYQFAPERVVEVERVVEKAIGTQGNLNNKPEFSSELPITDFEENINRYLINKYYPGGSYKLLKYNCGDSFYSPCAFELISPSTSNTVDLSKKYILDLDDRRNLHRFVHSQDDGKVLYFQACFIESDAGCSLVKYDTDIAKFSIIESHEILGPYHHIIGKYSIAPDAEGTKLLVFDMEQEVIVDEIVIAEGSLISNLCGLGTLSSYDIQSSTKHVVYGVYKKSNSRDCLPEKLMEYRVYTPSV